MEIDLCGVLCGKKGSSFLFFKVHIWEKYTLNIFRILLKRRIIHTFYWCKNIVIQSKDTDFTCEEMKEDNNGEVNGAEGHRNLVRKNRG